ncbi:MAG TPA: hypothetical protein VMR97_02480 [Acidimicrobiales bacterium]|nr:hypothetical protein [Acidimicrobiales bacterium]
MTICQPQPRPDREELDTLESEEEQPVRFASVLVFNKREAFDLCEACAEAERALLRSGRVSEAARMAALFELAEGRLALR